MTMTEARERKLTRIRKPYWNPQAHLVLTHDPEFGYGPWVTLVDPPGQAAIGTGPQNLLAMQADDGEEDWEPFEEESREARAGDQKPA